MQHNLHWWMSPSSGKTQTLQLHASEQKKGSAEHLSVFVVNAEGDGGGMQEQPRLLLIHLLPQSLHTTLTLRSFLNAQKSVMQNVRARTASEWISHVKMMDCVTKSKWFTATNLPGLANYFFLFPFSCKINNVLSILTVLFCIFKSISYQQGRMPSHP